MKDQKPVIKVKVLKLNCFVVSDRNFIYYYIDITNILYEIKIEILYKSLLNYNHTIYDIRSVIDDSLFKTY